MSIYHQNELIKYTVN